MYTNTYHFNVYMYALEEKISEIRELKCCN